jgi:glycosyltransferase involved in cell wall biosynthesis
MKILIVNTSDIEGGAARASYRLFKALENENIEVSMLVQKKSSDNYKVFTPNTKIDKLINIFRPILEQLPVKFYKNRTKTLFSSSLVGNKKILKMIEEINPDIVHLHWINGGMMKIEDLSHIKAPIVWSLHDMWAFTGGCHYDEECGLFKNECASCKVLGSVKSKDLSKKIFDRKKKTFFHIENMTIVGLSKWLHKCAKESIILENKKHINLPNPIDTNIFKPFDKEKARELWSLPKDKKLILFGAMGATSDPRKGFDELSNAMQKLENKNIEFIIFGSSKPKYSQNFGFKTHYLGSLADDISLVTLYSAVDIMIVPSLQENLSNAIMESLACATPVIGFDIGGNSDMIEHKKNGYLAKPFDTTDLACGIDWILDNEKYEKYDELCVNARNKVLKEFDSVAVANKYIELYKDILR